MVYIRKILKSDRPVLSQQLRRLIQRNLDLRMPATCRSILSIVLLLLAIVRSEEQTARCVQINGYTVCDENGTLTEVTEQNGEDTLIIENLKLVAIRKHAFKNLTTRNLYLDWGNNISAVVRKSFAGLENLETLRLDNNMVSLSAGVFAELKQLKMLSLFHNGIAAIPHRTFHKLTSLTELVVSYNSIEIVTKNTFSDLSSLERLSLQNNNISSINAESFGHMSALHLLDLSSNSLESIPDGLFRGLNQLQYLYLRNNRLYSIGLSDFSGLNSLIVLSLKQNRLTRINAGTFADLAQLTRLELCSNEVSDLEPGAFRGLNSLQDLDLTYNKMTTLSCDIFGGHLGTKNPVHANDSSYKEQNCVLRLYNCCSGSCPNGECSMCPYV